MKAVYFTLPLAAMVIMAIAMLCTTRDLSGQISFTRLEEGAYLIDISDDGAVAAGHYFSKAPVSKPLRWTRTTGVAPLGSVPHVASGPVVSGDGNAFAFSTFVGQGVRWTEKGGAVPLSGIPGVFTFTSVPFDISRDGSVIVGSASISSAPFPAPSTRVPFRWSESGGMINLGGLGVARGVSADGSAITGGSDNASGLAQPFRWTEADGMQRLITRDDFMGFGSALNPDGTVIVGSIRPAPYRFQDDRAFRWTEGDGLTLLGSVAGRPTHFASGVSADGSTIIGASLNGAGYIWTPASGARDLLSLMRNEFGLRDELEGWESLNPYGITPDGRFIVGIGSVDYVGAGWILDRGEKSAPIPVVPEAATYGLAAAALLFGFVLRRQQARKRSLED